jgi:hypothetical protein
LISTLVQPSFATIILSCIIKASRKFSEKEHEKYKRKGLCFSCHQLGRYSFQCFKCSQQKPTFDLAPIKEMEEGKNNGVQNQGPIKILVAMGESFLKWYHWEAPTQKT